MARLEFGIMDGFEAGTGDTSPADLYEEHIAYAQVPLYHPIRLAQDAAMVDQLSHGRLDFGLGYGPRIDEFRRWKLPFTERREMGNEAMEIILKAWTEDTVTYEGEYWSFDEALPK